MTPETSDPTPTSSPQGNGSSNQARLALRRVLIDTYHENVAYMHRECDIYRAEGFKALYKVEVRANGRSILATLNVVDDSAIVACGELGLSKSAFGQMGLEDGHTVTVAQAEPPESIGALHRKLGGERLNLEDFHSIVHDIAEHRYSKIELTAFVVATNRDEMDREEVYFLTEAMIAVGRHLDWHENLVVDKHCIGGTTLAAFHCLLYLGFIPKGIQPCSQTTPCSEVKLQLWGFVTIPLMSLAAFLVIVIALFLLKRNFHEEK